MFNNLIEYKNQIAFFDNNKSVVYYKDIISLSNKLKKKISKNSVNLLIMSNCTTSLLIYSSLIYSKFTTIIIDESLGKKFVDQTIEKYRVNYIFEPKTTNVSKKNKFIIEFDKYILLKKKNFIHNLNKQNLILLPTSGTTASPKFVRLSEDNLFFNSQHIINSLKIKKNHIPCTSLPTGFAFGLSIINTHLMVGAKIFITKKTIIEKSFWDDLNKYKITSLSGVPSTYELLINFKLLNKIPNRVRYFAQAGGKLEDKFIDKMISFSKKNKKFFFVMYGQTEASPRISCINVSKNLKKKYSIGKPFKETYLKINKNNGELILYGRNVCLGYSQNYSDLESGDTNFKKLYTGDKGRKDKDGFFYISGRIKKISKIHGLRIDLNEVENFLKEKNITSEAIINDKLLWINLNDKNIINNVKSILSYRYKINKKFIFCNYKAKLKKKIKVKSWKNFS